MDTRAFFPLLSLPVRPSRKYSMWTLNTWFGTSSFPAVPENLDSPTNVSWPEGPCWRYIRKLAEWFHTTKVTTHEVCLSVWGDCRRGRSDNFGLTEGDPSQRLRQLSPRWTKINNNQYIWSWYCTFLYRRSYKVVLSCDISALKPLWEQLHSAETRRRPPTRQRRDANRTWQPGAALCRFLSLTS